MKNIKEVNIFIPAHIFRNRRLSVLEATVVFLKEKKLRFSEIAKLLGRDQRNVWATYTRAELKIKKLEKVKEVRKRKLRAEKVEITKERLLEILELAIGELREKHKLTTKEILSLIEFIPVSVFREKLGALEVIVKYMKEDLGMRFSEIAKLTGRDNRTIWTAYHKACKK